MKKSFFKSLAIALAGTLFLASCGEDKKADNPNHIKVGVEAGPEYNVAEVAKKVAKEKYGLEVELVSFTDYVQPNVALNDKEIDANAIQHKPYLDDQIEKRGFKLVVVGNTFIYPMAGFSNKIKSIDELKEGDMVAIPNDATNGGRALLLLQAKGLIKLKDPNSLVPRYTDIIENSKKLEIKELDGAQLPANLDDPKVAMAIINNTFAAKAGLTLDKAIVVEDKESPYVNIIVSREDNKEAENVKKFVEAYQSDEVAQAADKEFKGGAIKGW